MHGNQLLHAEQTEHDELYGAALDDDDDDEMNLSFVISEVHI